MIKKRIITVALLVIMMFAMAAPSFATDSGVMPCLNNTDSTEAIFVIDDNGEAIVAYICYGYEGITSRIVVEIKIEKKFLWWWNDVDGASWTDETTGYSLDNEHSIQLSKSGTYRAVITYTVYGSGGEADVLTNEIEKKY